MDVHDARWCNPKKWYGLHDRGRFASSTSILDLMNDLLLVVGHNIPYLFDRYAATRKRISWRIDIFHVSGTSGGSYCIVGGIHKFRVLAIN